MAIKSKRFGTHFQGPLLGSHRAGGGLLENLPVDVLSNYLSPYQAWYEDFGDVVQNIAGLELMGWAETAINTPTASTIVVNTNTNCLVLNAGTKAGSGTEIQFISAPSASSIVGPHNIFGPHTLGDTQLDDAELVLASTIGFNYTGAFDGHWLFGWCVTDTAIVDNTDGTLALATGGGVGFLCGETGAITGFSQNGTTVTSTATLASMPAGVTPANGQPGAGFREFGIRMKYRDASAATGHVEFYIDGRLVGTLVDNLPSPDGILTFGTSYVAHNGPTAALAFDLVINDILSAQTKTGTTRLTE